LALTGYLYCDSGVILNWIQYGKTTRKKKAKNMDKAIGKELIKRKIIKEETEIKAMYSAVAFGGIGTVENVGDFTINSVDENSKGVPFFHARSNVDGKWEDITLDRIILVDGMEPVKLAEAYGIKNKTKKVKKKK